MPIARNNMTTTPAVPGRTIQEALGIVSAECVLGINVFRDMLGGLRDFFGGRSGTHQKALREAKDTCLEELAEQEPRSSVPMRLSVSIWTTVKSAVEEKACCCWLRLERQFG